MGHASAERTLTPERCVIVVDVDLPAGRAANAAAVIALTIGQRYPGLVGASLIDASGSEHPGLISIGITVLAANAGELSSVRARGLETGCDVIDFPVQGQQTTNYAAFREAIAQLATSELRYVGVAIIGAREPIKKIVGKLALLK